MALYQRVLVPCDFSPPSTVALEQGATIAESVGAELIVLHVLSQKVKRDDLQGLKDDILHRLEASLPAERVLKLTVKFQVREGMPAREIVTAADEHASDIIIMGTRGRTGIAHLALGSIAESVLKTASCPVMVVRATDDNLPRDPVAESKIVIADELDSSPAVDLLRRAEALRATDIHFDPVSRDEYLIRFRIDGRLEEYCRMEAGLAQRQLHQYEVMAQIDTNHTAFRGKEGRLPVIPSLPGVEVRYTAAPVAGGDSASLRISSQTNVGMQLDNLGLPENDLLKVDALLRQGAGLILITGPTGSGKSTTVYSMLNRMASSQRNIVSIEDPVEYSVPYVRQMAVDERHEVTMTAGLKTILRMDPDVIFVGEIRDTEAAEITMRAASSGRHVFSTLHTRDVASTLTALLDLGIPANSIGANLKGVLNQRLIRRLCPHCRVPHDITDAEKAAFAEVGIEPPAQLFDAPGCESCRGRGYLGRVGIFEVAAISQRIAEAISQSTTEDVLRQLLRADGVPSLRMAGLQKAAEGLTSLAEVDAIHWS
ncbi:MAG: ATPase, T2SS/T4P/T4SS family [Planctomycetaceae bacterium]